MAIHLNQLGYDYAKRLISNRKAVVDEKSDWDLHHPTIEEENIFMHLHGPKEYVRWYLAVDDNYDDVDPAHYLFPHGDFEKAHRCEVLIAEQRAGKNNYSEIGQAATNLRKQLEMLT